MRRRVFQKLRTAHLYNFYLVSKAGNLRPTNRKVYSTFTYVLTTLYYMYVHLILSGGEEETE